MELIGPERLDERQQVPQERFGFDVDVGLDEAFFAHPSTIDGPSPSCSAIRRIRPTARGETIGQLGGRAIVQNRKATIFGVPEVTRMRVGVKKTCACRS